MNTSSDCTEVRQRDVYQNKRERESMSFNTRFSIMGEVWGFMRVRKKWWLGPILVTLLLLGMLIVFTQTSTLAPFIYTLF